MPETNRQECDLNFRNNKKNKVLMIPPTVIPHRQGGGSLRIDTSPIIHLRFL